MFTIDRQLFLKSALTALTAAPFFASAAARAGGAVSGDYCLSIKEAARKTHVDFELPVLDGNGTTMKFSEISGKAVWLNFYASWCPPCNAEMGNIVSLYEKYRAEGLSVIGIDVNEPDEKARAFRDKYGIKFPILLDHKGDVFGRLFGSHSVPSSLFYDKERYLTCIVLDDLSRKQMDNEIAVSLRG